MKKVLVGLLAATAAFAFSMPVQAQVMEYGPNGASLIDLNADQLVAGNHAGTDVEAKTVSGTGGITVTPGNGTLVIDGAGVVGTNPGTGFTANAKSASFSASVNNAYFVSNTATATLPTAVGVGGKQILLVITATHVLTLATTSAQTINGTTPTTDTTTGDQILLTSDGANWWSVKTAAGP